MPHDANFLLSCAYVDPSITVDRTNKSVSTFGVGTSVTCFYCLASLSCLALLLLGGISIYIIIYCDAPL